MNDYSAVVAGTLFGDCTDLKGQSYSMVLDGLAPGIFWGQSYFTLACPAVSMARLNRTRHMKFGAFRATAAAGVGATAGFMINPTGGACVLAGFEIGVGATLNIGYMGLHTGTVSHNNLRSMWWDKKTKKRKHARKRNGLH